MPTYANHHDEIAAALRANAAGCDSHARTLVGVPARSSTPPPESKPEPAHDIHFAKSVLAMHFTRLYRLFGQEFGIEEAEEVRAAVDAIVTEAVQKSRVKPNVSPHAVAQHIDLHAVAHLLRPGIAREIDLTDLAHVLMPLVLPEIERQARAVVAAERVQVEMPAPRDDEEGSEDEAGPNVLRAKPAEHAPMKWIRHANIVGMVAISNCTICGEHHPRRAAYEINGDFFAFCPRNQGMQIALNDFAPLVVPVPPAPAFDSAEALEKRTIDRVMELRGALEQLLKLDIEDANPDRERWSPRYRSAVDHAEKLLGKVPVAPTQQYRGPDTNGCQHPGERPATATPEKPAMVWEQLAGDSKTARVLNCSACGHDHARVRGVQHPDGHWYFTCPINFDHVVLTDFPEIPW